MLVSYWNSVFFVVHLAIVCKGAIAAPLVYFSLATLITNMGYNEVVFAVDTILL